MGLSGQALDVFTYLTHYFGDVTSKPLDQAKDVLGKLHVIIADS
jgi:hypothetical protein